MGKFSFVVAFMVFGIANLHSNIVKAQTIFESITIRENELIVYIECTIKAGNTCNGLRILRSTDGINFHQIGAVTGICGDERISVKYNLTDDKPILNSLNYYKIEPGGFEVSETVSIFVADLKGNAILIFPNPAHDYINILILQELVVDHTIQISDINGFIIYRSALLNSRIELPIGHLLPGIHVVTVYDSNQRTVTSNKFTKL